MTKREKTVRSRRAVEARDAEADRTRGSGDLEHETDTARVVAWPEQASAIDDTVDADRRRSRDEGGARLPAPPPRLGETLRRRTLFLLPPDDDSDGTEAREQA
jgi:hypothetical protein